MAWRSIGWYGRCGGRRETAFESIYRKIAEFQSNTKKEWRRAYSFWDIPYLPQFDVPPPVFPFPDRLKPFDLHSFRTGVQPLNISSTFETRFGLLKCVWSTDQTTMCVLLHLSYRYFGSGWEDWGRGVGEQLCLIFEYGSTTSYTPFIEWFWWGWRAPQCRFHEGRFLLSDTQCVFWLKLKCSFSHTRTWNLAFPPWVNQCLRQLEC